MNSAPRAASLRGSVYGGQQPITSSAVYLYAATSGSSVTPSVSLLKASAGTIADGSGRYYTLTNAAGYFDMAPGGTPAYSCSAGQQLYIIAVGGNAGYGNNSAITVAAPLGDCSTISNATAVSVNEVSTVAAAYALQSVAVTPTEISACAGQSPCNVSFATAAMAVAFGNVPNLIDTANGTALTTTSTVSVRRTHVDSYRFLAAHAVGVSCGSLWMDKLASPGRTAAR